MIVDWADNCEKIFLTKKLSADDPSDNKSKFKQEVIYLKYLSEVMELPKERCFDEWKLVSNGIASVFSNDAMELEVQFDKLFKKASKSRYSKLNYKEKLKPIVLFQEEVDFLNSLNVPMWVRQYWGALLFYYKFEYQNTTRVQKSSTLNSWCIRHTDLKQQRYGSKCQDNIAKYKSGLDTKVILDFVKTGNDRYPSYFPEFMVSSGTPVFVATKIDQVGEFLGLLEPTKHTCLNCGCTFEAGSKTKRFLCDNCYRIYRRNYKTMNKRIERAKGSQEVGMSTGKGPLSYMIEEERKG